MDDQKLNLTVSPTQVPDSSPVSPSINSLPIIIIKGVFICVIASLTLAIVCIIFLKINYFQIQKYILTFNNPPYTPDISLEGTVKIPVDLNNPSLRQFAVVNGFWATVKEVKQTSEGPVIITNLSGPNIPQFLIDNTTDIFFGEFDRNANHTTIKSLKPGVRVKLSMLYYFHSVQYYPENKWILRKVGILGN